MLRLQDDSEEEERGLPGVDGRHDPAGDDQPGAVQAAETAGAEAEGETEVPPSGGGRRPDPPPRSPGGGAQGRLLRQQTKRGLASTHF